MEDYIDALSEHLLRIQDEELEITKQFSAALKQLSGEKPEKRERKEDVARNLFLSKVTAVRERRKHFREMLYDALQERKKLWESTQLQKDEEEALKRKVSVIM